MAALVAVVAVALAVPLAVIVNNDSRTIFVAGLENDTLSTASVLASQPPAEWQATVDATAARTGARVVVVDTDLVLVADSDQTGIDRAFDRPEISAALAGNLASDVRYSQTLQQELRYVAAPVVQAGEVVAAVRLSLPESDVSDVVARTRITLIVFVVAVVIAAGLVAWLLAASIAAPLRRVAEVAEDLPDDLSLRASADGPAEVRSIATALNRTAARLGELIARQQRVAADASHHLKTPLTGIRLRLEAIEDTAADEAVRREAAAAMAEVDRLHRRIDQILALARADAADESNHVIADLAAVIVDRCGEFEPVARDRGIELTVKVPSDPVAARAPRGAVERATDEVLSNALDYARTAIVVSVSATPEGAVVAISDDGPGIAAEDRDRVFERFVRGGNAVAGGSGVGLAIVRELARAAGGDAVAGVADAGGCRISVTWPRT
jgi:signal transduction histidine kinase